MGGVSRDTAQIMLQKFKHGPWIHGVLFDGTWSSHIRLRRWWLPQAPDSVLCVYAVENVRVPRARCNAMDQGVASPVIYLRQRATAPASWILYPPDDSGSGEAVEVDVEGIS